MAKEVFSSTCTMDCPDTCAVAVHVENGRVTALTGGTEHPITDGFICGKVGRFARRLYHEDRLLYPMKRSGPKGSGSFQRISWGEAVDTITSKYKSIKRTYGGEAILPYHYGGSNGFLSDGFSDALYFARLGASRLARTVCAVPTGEVYQGMYGKMAGVAFEDFPHARFILIWGTNPKFTSIHTVPLLKKARQNGAFIAVVDPINRFSQGEVDLHLPVRPGTDLPLALAMINYWREHKLLNRPFMEEHTRGAASLLAAAEAWSVERAAEETGIPADDIVSLAMTYATSMPALLRCGWGQERNSNGGQASAAIMAMPALLGKFGQRGGGFTMSNSAVTRLDMNALLDMPAWDSRELNMTELADFLETPPDPPVKSLFVYNCNPVATVPDQVRLMRHLADEDLFTVVCEQVRTDTALYADILLPATTFLEHHDLRKGYGAYVLGGARPVVARQGDSRPNHEIFSMLGKAMGFSDKAFDWSMEEAFDQVAGAVRLPGDRKPDVARLRAGGVVRAFPDNNPVQFAGVWPNTEDGKVNLTPAQLGETPYSYQDLERAGYPLALVSPASGKMITSTFGEFNYPVLEATLHPADAEARSIESGDTVRVYNELGAVVCIARVSAKMAVGVICLPKGAWRKSSKNGFTSTALCPTTINVVGGGACYNDARVEVELVR